MHSVTLSFPTLAELVAAVGAVERFQAKVDGPDAATRGARTTPVKAEKPAAAPAPAVEKKVEEAAAAAAPAAQPKAETIPYAQLQKAVFGLAGKGDEGKAACAALCAEFKVKTFKELPADKWAEALKAVEAKQAELEAVPA